MLERVPTSKQEWHPRVPAFEWKRFSELPKDEREKLSADTSRELMDTLSAANGEAFDDMSVLYSKLKGERLIVRRAEPDAIASALTNRTPVHLSFSGDTPYNNAVEWSADMGPIGITNAYLEGYAQKNAVVALFGFKPQEDRVAVSKLEHTATHFGDMRRDQVRSVTGTVEPGDIRFVSLRIPAEAYPEEHMTEDEQDRLFEYRERLASGQRAEPVFIHRGYLFAPPH